MFPKVSQGFLVLDWCHHLTRARTPSAQLSGDISPVLAVKEKLVQSTSKTGHGALAGQKII